MIFVDALAYDEWLKWRELGLGGSDAGTIMGVSPWETPLELWQRRTARLEAQEQNFPMKRGLKLEPEARLHYEEITGIAMPKQLGIHEVHGWLRASFDGLSVDAGRAIEIKCPGKADHKEACEGRIPAKYLWQLVHLMLVSDLPVIDYVSYDERTTAIIPMKRDFALEARLIKKEMQFWECIKNDVPPTATPIRAKKKSTVFQNLFSEGVFKTRKARR